MSLLEQAEATLQKMKGWSRQVSAGFVFEDIEKVRLIGGSVEVTHSNGCKTVGRWMGFNRREMEAIVAYLKKP